MFVGWICCELEATRRSFNWRRGHGGLSTAEAYSHSPPWGSRRCSAVRSGNWAGSDQFVVDRIAPRARRGRPSYCRAQHHPLITWIIRCRGVWGVFGSRNRSSVDM